MWVFGYGSLIWKVGFPYEEKRQGWIEGWKRRFWQDSTDHRGVPEAPGRVVTLVPEAGATTWGVAYRLGSDVIDDVLSQLDFREKGGYERHFAPVHGPSGPIVEEALVYVATRDNPNWGGELPLAQIAEIVTRSHGPSGANTEYVLELAEALRAIGADDEHVFGLAEQVRRLLENR